MTTIKIDRLYGYGYVRKERVTINGQDRGYSIDRIGINDGYHNHFVDIIKASHLTEAEQQEVIDWYNGGVTGQDAIARPSYVTLIERRDY